MRKTSLSCLVLALAFGLFSVKAVQAVIVGDSYGPPANIPAGMPDLSNIPGGIPAGMPDLSNISGGAPAGVNMGPSAKQLEEMNSAQAEGEKRMKEGEAKQAAAETKALKRMKEKAIPNVKKAVAMFQAQVDKLTKKGTPITSEMIDSMAKLKDLVSRMEASTTIDEMEKLLDELSGLIEDAQKNVENYSKFSQWPAVKKQADGLIVRLKKEAKTLRDKASKKGMLDDLKENFDRLDQVIADQEADLIAMNDLVKNDPDTVFGDGEKSVGQWFDRIRGAYEDDVRGIASSVDIKAAIKNQLSMLVKNLQKRVDTLNKNKKFKGKTASLQVLVDQAKTKLKELQALAVAKPMDLDAVITSVDDLTSIGEPFETEFEKITGSDVNVYEPTKLLQPDKKDEVKLPAGLNAYINPAK